MKLTSLIIVLLIILNSPCFGQTLTASWYSVESLKREGTWAYSHGRMANGQLFTDRALTCACRIYLLGSILIIENLQNSKIVYVRVTDRIGKRFAKSRIDLSISAFREIANPRDGLIKVKVEKI